MDINTIDAIEREVVLRKNTLLIEIAKSVLDKIQGHNNPTMQIKKSLEKLRVENHRQFNEHCSVMDRLSLEKTDE